MKANSMQPINSRREAQVRAEWIRVFQEELAALEHQGVLELTPGQKAKVRAHHEAILASLTRSFDIDSTEAQKKISWGMRIASMLGAFAFCAALYLFFQRFWESLPTPLQIAVLVIAPLIFLFAAEIVRRHERTPYYTLLLTTISAGAFVLNLSMIGQMFNVTPTPGALLAWGMYGLLLAYHFRLRLLLAAAVACLICYAAGAYTSWTGFDWLSAGDRPENFILAGLGVLGLAQWLPHPKGSDFQWVYRLCGLTAALMPMIILSEWGYRSYLPLEAKSVAYLYQVLGLLSSAAGIWLSIRERFTAGVNVSTLVFSLLLLLKMVDWWWDWVPKYLFFLIIGCAGVLVVAVLKRLRIHVREAEVP
jgi:uncharacterized membrane protein